MLPERIFSCSKELMPSIVKLNNAAKSFHCKICNCLYSGSFFGREKKIKTGDSNGYKDFSSNP